MPYATAPYNFVSPVNLVLPAPFYNDMCNALKKYEDEYSKKIKRMKKDSADLVKAEKDKENDIISIKKEVYKKHIKENGKLSGYIQLNIQTLTPCFVGQKEKNPTFFSPNEIPVIPGSTLRGAIKNIFKIVTCSKLRYGIDDDDISDDKLYYRTLADKNAEIREMYSKEIPDQIEGQGRNAKKFYKAGFVIHLKKEDRYYICESSHSVVKNEVLVTEKSGSIEDNDVPPGSVKWNIKDQIVTCFTGPMKKKKHYTEHKLPQWSSRHDLSDDTVNAYKNDKNRHEKMNILDPKCHLVLSGDDAKKFTGIDDCDLVAPCFYKLQQNVVTHFGFGRNHRIPYKRKISDHFPMRLSDRATIDYSDALFGNKELWGSRIFFEDAVFNGEISDIKFQDRHWMNPLLEPNPTSFQLYLNQKDTADSEINNWDTKGIFIRGYKMYWHQKDSDSSWHFRPNDHAREPSESVTQEIKPLASGNLFTGKIRFERLSTAELGALLKVCTIAGDDVCIKIGKGKALGMGSIKIVPKLYLLDDGDKHNSYINIFSDDGSWIVPERDKAVSFNEYIEKFDNDLSNDPAYKNSSALIQEAYATSMSELKAMLDWDNVENRNWTKETAGMSMDGDGYTNRYKLPTALEVVDNSR